MAIAFQICFSLCHQEGSGKPGQLTVNGTHFLVCAVDVNILGGSVDTVKKNTFALEVPSNKI